MKEIEVCTQEEDAQHIPRIKKTLSFGTKIPSFTIMPEVGFIMTLMKGGITILEMDFTTNLRMEIIYSLIPIISVINQKLKARVNLSCKPNVSRNMIKITKKMMMHLSK